LAIQLALDWLTSLRRMSKLSKQSRSLSRHNEDVADALRRIRLDTNLSTEDIREALDEVLSMVSDPAQNVVACD